MNVGQLVVDVASKTFFIQFSQTHMYVALAGLFVYIVHLYLAFGHVMPARLRFNIKYPLVYETPNEKGDLKTDFNLYQRGHMVEFLILTLRVLLKTYQRSTFFCSFLD
jgi:hypothetical protein